jgi:hypothetical protein
MIELFFALNTVTITNNIRPSISKDRHELGTFIQHQSNPPVRPKPNFSKKYFCEIPGQNSYNLPGIQQFPRKNFENVNFFTFFWVFQKERGKQLALFALLVGHPILS